MSEKRYLTGIRPEMDEAFQMLEQVFEEQVFEVLIQERDGKETEVRIPYMLNDALECTLLLKNCRIRGDLAKLRDGLEAEELSGSLEEKDGGYGLILRQGSEAAALWFQGIRIEKNFYQYHVIGHFWAKGQEQWRRIAYIVGTIQDKYRYFGSASCSRKEIELGKLSEYGPLMRWSPLGDMPGRLESMSLESIAAMEKFAAAAGDQKYLRLLKLYRRFPVFALARILAKALTKPERMGLYLLLEKEIEKASLSYQKRDYGKEKNRENQKQRETAERKLKELGFDGKWPEYQKGRYGVVAMEEHPFCCGDGDDFTFRIQFMVSQTPRSGQGKNGGFFQGRGRKGWIAKNVQELAERLEKEEKN